MQPQKRRLLVKRYGASLVSKALAFKSESLASREIRTQAINEYGGVLVNL